MAGPAGGSPPITPTPPLQALLSACYAMWTNGLPSNDVSNRSAQVAFGFLGSPLYTVKDHLKAVQRIEVCVASPLTSGFTCPTDMDPVGLVYDKDQCAGTGQYCTLPAEQLVATDRAFAFASVNTLLPYDWGQVGPLARGR